MTNKTIEDVEHLNQLNKKVSEMVSRWVNEAKEEGIKIGLGADKAELIEKLLQENKALREQAAQTTLPSLSDFATWLGEFNTRNGHRASPVEMYQWLRDNSKVKERHEVKCDKHEVCNCAPFVTAAALERK